jgi:outer membrane protein OmpA-like peptidoglycan-associated protein
MIDAEIEITKRLRVSERSVAEERRSLSSQSEAARSQTAKERQALAADLAAEKRHVEASEALRGADLSLKTAETVDALRYAKAKFSAASDMLQLAHKEFDAGNWDAAIAKATVSRAEAAASTEVATPLYEKVSQMTQTRARDRALEAAATALPGVRTTLEREGDKQRLVLSLDDLFPDKQAVVLPRAAPILDGVRDLLTKYPTYPLQITGYGDDQGKPTDLAALSLARANAVFWALVSRGVDPKRILVEGKPGEPSSVDNLVALARPKNTFIRISILYHIFEQ